MGDRQHSTLYTEFSVSLSPASALTVPRLTTTYDPFRDVLWSALNTTHDTKTVKHSSQHCCTAVADGLCLIDKSYSRGLLLLI
jgi:hypothetical protein